MIAALAASAPAEAAAPRCATTHWVGVWSAPPTDASRGTGLGDRVDGSLNEKTATRDDTTRAILTPTYGGSTLRVRLSNRFGDGPVTFAHVTVARRQAGAALVPGTTAREVRFGGRRSVTVAAGRDVVSDATTFSFRAFASLGGRRARAGRRRQADRALQRPADVVHHARRDRGPRR